ncbi:MAG TPA: hypothetical protein VJ697_03945 [Nitrososphaeraceae archaeon]|nr:hypothetical protein [Nitrososphaeraceae archaeon]
MDSGLVLTSSSAYLRGTKTMLILYIRVLEEQKMIAKKCDKTLQKEERKQINDNYRANSRKSFPR